MAPAKGTVYTIFPGEEFVPFLFMLQLEKIDSLLPVPFPQTLGREKCSMPEPPTLSKMSAHLRVYPGPFLM